MNESSHSVVSSASHGQVSVVGEVCIPMDKGLEEAYGGGKLKGLQGDTVFMERYPSKPVVDTLPSLEGGSVGRSLVLGTVSLLCGLIGGGSLTVPYAFALMGWWGIPVLVVVGMIAGYSAVLLGDMGHSPGSGSSLDTYSAIAERAYGKKMAIAVKVVQFTELVAACVLYLILFSNTMSAVVPSINEREWIIIALVCVYLLSFFKTLSDMFWVTVGGVGMLVAVALVVVVQDGVDGRVDESYYNSKIVQGTTWQVFTGIGIFITAFGGHSVFPEIFASVTVRKVGPKCAAISFTVATLLYALLATSSYAVHGEKLKYFPNILLLLHKYTYTYIAMCMFSLFLLVASRILLTPIWMFTESVIRVGESEASGLCSKRGALHALWRFVDIVFLAAFAICIPSFEVFQSLIGGSVSVLLCFVFPELFYLKICSNSIGSVRRGFLWAIIIIFTILGGVIAYTSVYSFITV
eukprot:Nk52_evm5s1400 gene=Nk52_evmTU5s1400